MPFWRKYALPLAILPFITYAPFSYGEQTLEPIHLFISPYCGLSVFRLMEAVPKLGELTNTGVPLRFDLIPLVTTASEERELRQLVCADQQGALPPMFLYIANSAHQGRTPQAERFLEAFGIDRSTFAKCMQDPSHARDILRRSSDLFFQSGLKGVPSVKYREMTFTPTNFDQVVALARSESEAAKQ